jgi:hypothetical protein
MFSDNSLELNTSVFKKPSQTLNEIHLYYTKTKIPNSANKKSEDLLLFVATKSPTNLTATCIIDQIIERTWFASQI